LMIEAEEPGEARGIRLQKVLSQAGIASRRAAEKLIIDGRVEIDGQLVTELGTRVDPDVSVIRVDGARVVVDDSLVYLALNKPRGMHSTMSDDRGRPCIGDLIEHRVRGNKKLFHVGRLDADTEGLILLTNDGELAHRLSHPRYGVLKTYLAEVPGPLAKDLGRRLTTGVELEDGTVVADRFRVVDQAGSRALVELTLHEGRKHVVRRMLAKVGHPVSRLVRIQVGPISLGSLRPAATRQLTTAEVGDLYAAVGM
jgi:23S rRNA pseudouridine2605 synthase